VVRGDEEDVPSGLAGGVHGPDGGVRMRDGRDGAVEVACVPDLREIMLM
jgi:hypothetical protein